MYGNNDPIAVWGKNNTIVEGHGRYLALSVWEIDKPRESKLHPTMKPIELIANALENSTKENDCVLDVFGGSGSTLIACEQLNRKCFMCELDERYCDVIVQRWENFTGKKAVLLNG
nr:DNA modification methylase [Clostridia bacterium]